MKSSWTNVIVAFLTWVFLMGCQKNKDVSTNNGDFSIEFSDGTAIHESDILFYDLSTHMLYLKQGISLQGLSTFSAIVSSDTIYHGIVQPSYFSSLPRMPIFVSDQGMYGNDIIEIGCTDDSADKRNDPRIISALEKNNLVHHGLSCTIDSVRVTSYSDHSGVTCIITVTNHDQFNYYILDPAKMGNIKFNYYTGGLLFYNGETHLYSFLRWSIPYDWSNLSVGELSILHSGEKVSYSFESADYYKMEKGMYEARYYFCGINHDISNFVLNQSDGRIWVGRVPSNVKTINVE